MHKHRWSRDEALAFAQSKRPQIQPNPILMRLLAEWDPDAIAARMRARRKDKDVIVAWARGVKPQDQHRWQVTAEQNWIDDRAAD